MVCYRNHALHQSTLGQAKHLKTGIFLSDKAEASALFVKEESVFY